MNPVIQFCNEERNLDGERREANGNLFISTPSKPGEVFTQLSGRSSSEVFFSGYDKLFELDLHNL
jgi:hypothetical protein